MQTRSRLARRTAALAPLVAAALLLTGCSGGDDKPAASPSAQASQGSDTDASGSEGTKDTEAEDTSDATSEGPSCLEGEWVADMAGQLEQTQAALAAAGVDATVDLSGDVVMAFTDGTATYSYAKQVTDMTIAAEGQKIRTVTTLDGSMTGTYTATDTDLTVTVADTSGLNLTMETYMGDTPVDAGLEGYGDAMREQMKTSSTVAYTCAGDTLTMSMTNATLGSAVETQLHRK